MTVEYIYTLVLKKKYKIFKTRFNKTLNNDTLLTKVHFKYTLLKIMETLSFFLFKKLYIV